MENSKRPFSLSNNKETFKEAYDGYSEMVYNVALSYAKDVHDAEEITQDVFLSVFKNLGKYRAQSAMRTWIYRITVNTSLNFLKKKKRLVVFSDLQVVEDEFIHQGTQEENNYSVKRLFQVIETLPLSQKTAFNLSYVDGLARQEVADVMFTSLKAIESLLQRAKKNLRVRLALRIVS